MSAKTLPEVLSAHRAEVNPDDAPCLEECLCGWFPPDDVQYPDDWDAYYEHIADVVMKWLAESVEVEAATKFIEGGLLLSLPPLPDIPRSRRRADRDGGAA